MTSIIKRGDMWLGPADHRLPLTLLHLQRPTTGLWVAGSTDVLHRGIRIGIVGSRLPRADSAAFAQRIAHECAAAGMTVVSGLAMGIDGIAHRAALAAGGATIAVLAGGLQAVHPGRHLDLAVQIAGASAGRGVLAGRHDGARGAVVSEYGAGAEPCRSYQFQMRNRIIAGLSDYVVVIQAKPQSGSLGTANAALDVGVPIGVVPSSPDDECYTGSIALIRDGADSVVDAVSLAGRLELHGVMRPGFRSALLRGAVVHPTERGNWIEPSDDQLSLAMVEPERGILGHLAVPRVLEEVAELSGLTIGNARRELIALERIARVRLLPDGSWSAV
ncbi:MAG: hypothetical protein JWN72_275 [Thermoleophilia bacterium]|nr:hypothetical protein [Thermoleophilia bacterium]